MSSPVREFIERSGGVYAADERAIDDPCDTRNLIATAAKFVDHPRYGRIPVRRRCPAQGRLVGDNQQPPSLAARTTTITADCWAVESLVQVELNVTGLATVDARTSFSGDSTWP